MKTSELRQKNTEELMSELESLFRNQFTLRMQKGIDQLNRHTQLNTVRRNIARVKTVLLEKDKRV